MAGRFAPSPTGNLHLGNLRTAVIAWASARAQGLGFLVRMEDLDRHQSSLANEAAQLGDLAAIGLDWDGNVVRQSERFDRYDEAIATLARDDLVYECYCTRREIRREIEAADRAPHGPVGAYPGTCRDLTGRERRRRLDEGRRPALRLRSDGREITFVDRVVGTVTGTVDDVVLRRNDGVPACNLAVVVDDAAQGIEQVVRGDDLATSSPRQRHLADLLRLPPVRYAHVALALAPSGDRLAKRDGSVTLAEQRAGGRSADQVRSLLAETLGLAEVDEAVAPAQLLERFDPQRLPRAPWTVPAELLALPSS
jgi:glutamyl-tRNA synthetase